MQIPYWELRCKSCREFRSYFPNVAKLEQSFAPKTNQRFVGPEARCQLLGEIGLFSTVSDFTQVCGVMEVNVMPVVNKKSRKSSKGPASIFFKDFIA